MANSINYRPLPALPVRSMIPVKCWMYVVIRYDYGVKGKHSSQMGLQYVSPGGRSVEVELQSDGRYVHWYRKFVV